MFCGRVLYIKKCIPRGNKCAFFFFIADCFFITMIILYKEVSQKDNKTSLFIFSQRNASNLSI